MSLKKASAGQKKQAVKEEVHTIVLAQFTENLNSRQYADFPTVADAMDGLCRIFESHLKKKNPHVKRIQYDVEDLFDFIKGVPDMSCLVFDKSIHAYAPHGKEWISKQIVLHLQDQARQAEQQR